MPYCTQADIEAAYGAEEIIKAQPLSSPPAEPETINAAAVAAAIDAATIEIDSYVMVRYRLPLKAELAARLKRRCVDMAMYHLSPTVSGTDDHRHKRYDDAVQWLEMVAKGKAVLDPRPAATIDTDDRRDFKLPTNYLGGSNDYWRKRYGGYKETY